MKEGTWELVDLYPGCHIRVKTNNFYHHAIYIGDGEVVQFGLPFDPYNNTNYKDIKVIRSPLKDFSKSMFIEVYVYSKKELKKKKKDSEIIKTALSSVGEGGYDILKNNCEHFVNYCIFGKAESHQVDEIYKEVEEKLKR